MEGTLRIAGEARETVNGAVIVPAVKLPDGACVAVMVALPVPTMVMVVPDTVATAGVSLE